MPLHPRRTVLTAGATALLALAATACGGAATADGEGSGKVTVRIAYQSIPNADLVVKNQRLLEKALPDAEIRWVRFDSGGDVNTAVIAGAVDLGLLGSSPVTKGLSAPLDIPYKVLWIHDLIGDNEALVARKEIGSVAALKGRKVAAPFGSTAHYSLLAALDAAGLSAADVSLVDLQPQDALAAWQRGDIDAAYVWTPSLTELRKSGKVLVTSREIAARGKPTADLGVVTDAFAGKHPEIVDAWLSAEDQAVKLAKSDPAKAAAAIGAELNLTPEEARAQLAELVLLTAKEQQAPAYLGTPGKPGALAGNLRDAAVFLHGQKAIDAVPERSVFERALAVEELARAAR
ncbi:MULTISPECIES: taurine ABC transporter substrate-binding protein [Streptomyces]|uniref:Glycine/betaine ABC transporter substrate-binding protein n=1 Tax=Streptomyces hydrogenans TaxID=1873719 RepID=A0ABQ3PJW9_9ACTN|nr:MULTISPECIES: glycine betaine ABC transporter substrate-binding protein [Streptomyces]MCM1945064.1 ABC transporter substrate-binding protein [Streptomyces sp. G2]GHG42045.1 glycine/betaine ABC transporter substrate-binding protein [Streptomyces hydrogenans]GHI25321.1 glycine/betaine ABC transporter substrate-binding protein [Streptomyces hydrogenans]